MTCVIDASTALSFVLADEFDEQAQRTLDVVTAHGAIVPALWHSEVANGLLSAWRRDRLTEAGVAHASLGLSGLPLDTVNEQPGMTEVIALARQLDLSAYDATYLWLATYRELPLATRDQRLLSAAQRSGIATLR